MDPLDAFMDAEVLPEVKEKEIQEEQRRREARQKFAKQMAVRPLLALQHSLPHSCCARITRAYCKAIDCASCLQLLPGPCPVMLCVLADWDHPEADVPPGGRGR